MLHTDTKKPEKKSPSVERLEARLKPEQKQLFKRAADLQGRSMTDFVLASAEEAAMRTIQEYELIKLTKRDREFFVSSLLKAPAPAPSKTLREAAARYKARMGL